MSFGIKFLKAANQDLKPLTVRLLSLLFLRRFYDFSFYIALNGSTRFLFASVEIAA